MDNQKDNFSALFEITRTINSILDPNMLLEKVLEIAMTHLSAERGFVMLSNNLSESGYTVVCSKNFNSKKASDEFAASSSVVNSVLQSGEAVLTFDAMSDERFESSVSIMAQKILSIICIPLRAGERISGAVYLDSSKSRKAFTEDALKFLTVFGSLAASAIDEDNGSSLQDGWGMFQQLSYRGTSLDELCLHCGITKPTLYYYFGNKETLFIQVLARQLHGFRSILDADGPLVKRLTERY